MILSDKSIKSYIQQEALVIMPYNASNIEAASIDLTLGDTYLIAKKPKGNRQSIYEPFEYKVLTTKEMEIPPNSFVLATTNEYVKICDCLSGWIEGRSSIGRAGLFIQNAGWIDPGFEGNITLELYNANHFSLVVYENLSICQMVLDETTTRCEASYKGKYQGQSTTTGSMSYKDLNNGSVR
ncbi:MAG: dCTP deaminase [Staphylococcus sp.]|uniref:dCTP deaminase n=1 Tax=Staphylococcus sp. TaxID=29387 RepID=UPI003F9AFAE8